MARNAHNILDVAKLRHPKVSLPSADSFPIWQPSISHLRNYEHSISKFMLRIPDLLRNAPYNFDISFYDCRLAFFKRLHYLVATNINPSSFS
jgi:hypothetical protein